MADPRPRPRPRPRPSARPRARSRSGLVAAAVITALPGAAAAADGVAPARSTATRGAGPAGSVLLVDESHAVPLVHVVVAARTGSASDPRHHEGLANLAGELARRGAAGRPREAIDEALDALGASLDVLVDPDSVRLTGQVLSRNLEPFLNLVADIVLRPDFKAAEFERTRREILAQIDETRNDDRSVCARFFLRRLYGDHPYGRAADGTEKSLQRLRREDAQEQFRRAFVGKNMIFAASGDVTPESFRVRVAAAFSGLRPGPGTAPPAVRPPAPPEGWRIQIVDKPDRSQTQIMFGHPAPPAAHPDFVPLTLALAAFGGRGMRSTLMDEVRTKRGLAYGAYLGLLPHRGPSAVRGWVFTGADRTVTTLKLVLRLYRQLMSKGLTADQVRFFQSFLIGSYASDMDTPERRLGARVSAEIDGLPANFVDSYPERLRAVTPEQVAAAIKTHVRADNLAITLVGTANTVEKMLLKSGIEPGSIDVVPSDSY